MCKALLIHKCDRYDIRGKKILNGKYKYYLADLGLGQVINSEKKKQMGAYLENIVYNELLSRGYEVKVGTLTNGEIDFIATRYEEKIYFQIAYHLYDEIIDREFGVYNNINDNLLRKYLLNSISEKYLSLYYAGRLYQYGERYIHRLFVLKNAKLTRTRLKAIIYIIFPRFYYFINCIYKRRNKS